MYIWCGCVCLIFAVISYPLIWCQHWLDYRFYSFIEERGGPYSPSLNVTAADALRCRMEGEYTKLKTDLWCLYVDFKNIRKAMDFSSRYRAMTFKEGVEKVLCWFLALTYQCPMLTGWIRVQGWEYMFPSDLMSGLHCITRYESTCFLVILWVVYTASPGMRVHVS